MTFLPLPLQLEHFEENMNLFEKNKKLKGAFCKKIHLFPPPSSIQNPQIPRHFLPLLLPPSTKTPTSFSSFPSQISSALTPTNQNPSKKFSSSITLTSLKSLFLTIPLPPSDHSAAAACDDRRTSVLWFRADLRIHDHEPLHYASNSSLSILLVFLFDPRDFGCSLSGFDNLFNSSFPPQSHPHPSSPSTPITTNFSAPFPHLTHLHLIGNLFSGNIPDNYSSQPSPFPPLSDKSETMSTASVTSANVLSPISGANATVQT